MQPAEAPHDLVTRAQMQMVRVSEDHRRAGLAEIHGVERFHRGLCSNGHECRRLDHAVWCAEPSGARRSALDLDNELKWIQSAPRYAAPPPAIKPSRRGRHSRA